MRRALALAGWLVALAGLLLAGSGLLAQGQGRPPAANAPSGTVTGRVMLGDTQRPARFAQVMLARIPADAPGDSGRENFGGFGGGGMVRTAADGTFTATRVAPGDYYVLAGAAGYMSARAEAQAAINAGATASDVLARLPVVHVAAESNSSTIVTLNRGGTISGHVQWEDGSPATGVQMSVVPMAKPVALPTQLQALRGIGGSGQSAVTDDRGAFRLLGLASGDYYVQAVIDLRQFGGGFGGRAGGVEIQSYAPGVFRKADAKPVTVRAGDERGDIQMVLDLSALHTVSGHVTSPTPGQTIMSGTVSITDTTDATVSASGQIGTNGDFAIPYVSAGNYTLTVSQASTQAPTQQQGFRGRGPAPASMFQQLQMSLSVTTTDVTGVTVALTAANTAQ